MARVQNCVMLFKMTARFPDICALGDILAPVSWQTKSKKTPFLWVVLSLSPILYIKHWSRWQLFCLRTGPKLKLPFFVSDYLSWGTNYKSES